MEPQFTKLLQIGIVVRDVDAAVRQFEENYGIGPWRIDFFDRETFKGLKIDGEVATIQNKCAFCSAFGMEFELIEPITDSVFKQWLEAHGPGIHHLAVVPRDGFDAALARHKALTGKDAWLRGQDDTVGMDFAYLDLTDQLGFMLEMFNEDRSGHPGHPV